MIWASAGHAMANKPAPVKIVGIANLLRCRRSASTPGMLILVFMEFSLLCGPFFCSCSDSEMKALLCRVGESHASDSPLLRLQYQLANGVLRTRRSTVVARKQPRSHRDCTPFYCRRCWSCHRDSRMNQKRDCF